MNEKLFERMSEFRVRMMSRRPVFVTILSVIAILLTVYVVLATYTIGNHEAWETPTVKWSGGQILGYSEGQAVVLALEIQSMSGVAETVDICLELDANKAKGFTDLVSPGDPLASQVPQCQPFGACGTNDWPPTFENTNFRVWGENIVVTGVTDKGAGQSGNTCGAGELQYTVAFEPKELVPANPPDPPVYATRGVLYYGALLAKEGAPIDRDGDGTPDETVPVGEGASNVSGNFQIFAVGGGGTIPFAGGSIAAADPDLSVSKSCPADLIPQNPPQPFTFTVDVTNLDIGAGASAVPIATAAFKDTYDATKLSWTGVSRFYYNTPGDELNFTNPGSGSCTLDVAGVQGAFTCTPASPPDPLAIGQTVRVELDFDLLVATSDVEISNEAALVIGDSNTTNDGDICSKITPVTISYFHASQVGEDVRFEWQTVAEVGNAGFNIYVETADGLQPINEELIRSHVTDSRSPQDYVYEAVGIEGDTFYIEDVTIEAVGQLHGPFNMGEAGGARASMEPIDWAAIRAEHEAKEAQREEEARARIDAALSGDAGSASGQGANGNGLSHILMPVIMGDGQGGTPSPQPDIQIDLIVSENGLYHVTYEDLKNAGFDLLFKNPVNLALLNQGQAVPMRVEAQWAIGSGDFIEFYGQALDTIYTDENVYTLVFDPDKALRMGEDPTAAGNAAPAEVFMETLLLEDENAYSAQVPPGGDPWYDTELFARTVPLTWNYELLVDNYVPGTAPVLLTVGAWGRGEWPGLTDNHHMQFAFNGQPVNEISFGGTKDVSFAKELPNGVLQEGSNTLSITLPGDTGALWEFDYLDSYGVIYPRAFVARDGSLTFTAKGDVFKVTGLPIGDVDVFRNVNGTPVQLTNVDVVGGSATFAGSDQVAKYVVVSSGAKKLPTIKAGRPYTDITSGAYDYLIISHPDFINELGALVTARMAQGYKVLVVDVDDVYDQFSYGIFDAQAIKDYATHAAQNMGVDYFLLIGGDTYDYRGYLVDGGMSFIPSLYAQIGVWDDIAPVDPRYVDLDDDLVQDRAIGRFPVRSSQELAWMIGKTLAYQDNVEAVNGYGGKAVYAADGGFKGISDQFTTLLGSGWQVERAYLDDMVVADAKAKLIAGIENGAALTNYIGHSSSVVWTFDGLFASTDVAALTNSMMPTVVAQWGCSNAYYVDPTYNTISHQFLVAGDAGAAVAMGSAPFSYNSSEEKLGLLMTPKLVQPGVPVGLAMQAAKEEMAATYSPAAHVDVMLGWTLLGDPALVIQPPAQP